MRIQDIKIGDHVNALFSDGTTMNGVVTRIHQHFVQIQTSVGLRTTVALMVRKVKS